MAVAEDKIEQFLSDKKLIIFKQPEKYPLCYQLFVHYQNSLIDLDSKYPEMRREANSVLGPDQEAAIRNPNGQEEIDACLKEIGVGNGNLVLNYENIDDRDAKFNQCLMFENFLKISEQVFEGYEQKFYNFQGFKRLVNPPLEAYKYIGHCKMDIKPSKSTYAALFMK